MPKSILLQFSGVFPSNLESLLNISNFAQKAQISILLFKSQTMTIPEQHYPVVTVHLSRVMACPLKTKQKRPALLLRWVWEVSKETLGESQACVMSLTRAVGLGVKELPRGGIKTTNHSSQEKRKKVFISFML